MGVYIMTHRELLMKHLNRHNATIVLNSKNLVIWEYDGWVTIDEFNDDGSAVGRTCHEA